MNSPARDVDAEALLAHREWVRALAGRLVRSGASVDDIEQQTWLAALAAPRSVRTTLRAWLGGVVRNVVRQAHRSDARRERREAVVARRDLQASAADVAATRDLHARVVAAVVALSPPLREAVLRRYFDGLPTREVAVVLGVPYETARSRLKEALSRLRTALAASAADGPQQPALFPLLLSSLAQPIPWAPVDACRASQGVLTMALTKKTAALIAVVILVPALSVGGAYLAARAAAKSVTGDDVAALTQRIAELEQRNAEDRSVADAQRQSRARQAADATDAARAAAAALDRRVGELEERLATLSASAPSAGSGLGGGTAPPSAPVSDDLSTMTDEQLLARARKLSGYATAAESIPLWKAVRDRSPTDRVAAEALFQTGVAHMFLDECAKAEPFLRQAFELAGIESPRGRNAAYQLGLCLQRLGRHRDALAHMETFGNDPRVEIGLAAPTLIAGATSARQVNEPERARAMYRKVIELARVAAEDPQDVYARKWTDDAKRGLEQLDR